MLAKKTFLAHSRKFMLMKCKNLANFSPRQKFMLAKVSAPKVLRLLPSIVYEARNLFIFE